MASRKRKKPLTGKNLILYTVALLLMAMIALFSNHETHNGTETVETVWVDSARGSGNMQVHYLDVGQGASALVESDGHYMLIDGGDRAHSSFVVSYLKKEGVEKLDYILATHYHADHLNGVIGAMNAFSCDAVICPDYESDTALYQSLKKTADEKKIPLLHPAIGDAFSVGSASFTVIAPVSYTYENENNNSIGIRLANGNDTFLFTGDAEARSEEDFCALNTDLSCDVYLAGHHGSASSTTFSLLTKALPEYVVISCGADNSYGHPHEETLEKLEAAGVKIFRTDLQGTVIASSSGHGIIFSKEPAADYSAG